MTPVAAWRTLSFAVDADGIALITLDDPSRPINVTSPELIADLMAALDRVTTDPAVRGAVITSGKAGSFVAGGDIKDFVGAHERGMTEAEAFEISHRWNVELRRIERCGKPIAAAINGVALGGGYELSLCCHHRVLVDDEKARVGLVDVSIGLLPAGGGTQRLPRLIGAGAGVDAGSQAAAPGRGAGLRRRRRGGAARGRVAGGTRLGAAPSARSAALGHAGLSCTGRRWLRLGAIA
jgi:enoyl-CoA hydratase/carnithine racemase